MFFAIAFCFVQSAAAIALFMLVAHLRRLLKRSGVTRQARLLVPSAAGVLFALVFRNLYVCAAGLPVFLSDWLLTVTGVLAMAVIVVCARLQVHRAELEELILNFSAIDALTGVFTKSAFLTVAEPLVLTARRFKNPLTALVVDIDHFSRIGEEFGPAISDESLRLFGAALAACVRKADVLGRLSGEKFAVVLPHTDLRGAALVAEKICATVARDVQLISAGQAVPLTASIGVAELQDGNLENLLNVADGVKHSSQHTGRGQIIVENAATA